MEERLGAIAWSIISDVHSFLETQVSDEPRILTEAVRLTALNIVLKSRFSQGKIGLGKDQILFQSFSFEGDSAGISKSDVLDLTKQTVDTISLGHKTKIQELSLNDFVNLLGWIHSLGSYRLPLTLNHGSFQRSLGAYYTPQSVADYIVNLTMRKDLEKRVHAISKSGLSSLEDFLSLRTLDPACGAGVFLISVANLMRSFSKKAMDRAREVGILESDIKEIFANNQPSLYGVDLDSGALEVADISLRLLLGNGTKVLPASLIGKTLKNGNSLISFRGLQGKSDYRRFFRGPSLINAFEWRYEFPEIFSEKREGFDFVVMNPPYDRLKPNLAEFIRERLATGERLIRSEIYEDHKINLKEATTYFRKSNEYHYATSYSINTYQLFVERALQLSRKGGYIGCVVPSNILGDVSAQRLREHLLQQNNLKTIDDFPETSRMFPGVTQSVSIITIQKGGQTDNIEVGFNRLSLKDALERKRMKIKRNRLLRYMGSTLAIPRIDAAGFKLLDILHNHPLLGSNTDVLIRRGELDLTINKNAITSHKTDTPLVRGSHISRFALIESRHKSEFVKKSKFKKTLETSSRSEHIDMNRIACQQVSNMGQRWRLKFAQVEPGTVLANSCNYIVVNGKETSTNLDYFLGILNSELMNWRFQISNFNNHVSIRELQNLPIVKLMKRGKTTRALSKAVRTLDYLAIEANVFALYGFSIRQAKSILEIRKTPKEEKTPILETLSSLV
ncbi:MAG: N-6 DNA methylase [Candidatus Thorarchaeota archaeon]|nr:N-6 DNA methylase [Candidatus Thorarchaeota archaeon]